MKGGDIHCPGWCCDIVVVRHHHFKLSCSGFWSTREMHDIMPQRPIGEASFDGLYPAGDSLSGSRHIDGKGI